MKASRERGWVGIVALGLAALAVAWTAAWALARGERRRVEDRGSSFGADAGGTRALSLMLVSEGVRVQPLTRPVSSGMEPGVLFVIAGESDLTDEEAETILDWALDGGHVIAAQDRANALSRLAGMEIDPANSREQRATALQGEPLVLRTRSGALVWRDDSVDLYGNSDGFVVSEVAWGDGWLTFVSDTWCATNEGIDSGDNILVWLQLAGRHLKGRPAWFLETIHGHLREPSMSEYMLQAGWAPLALHVVLLVLMGAWYFGVRPAPVLGTSMLVRRPAAEHAATMAHLYRRGQASRHALGVILEDLEVEMKRPSWERGLLRLDAADRAKVQAEGEQLLESGRQLGLRGRPAEESIRQWAARVARLKGRLHERIGD